MPGDMVPRQVSEFDKVLHFSIYALLAVLLSRQISEVTGRWRAATLAILIAVAFGAADEWHQRFIPGRSTELADWRADSMGATIGAFAFAATRRKPRPRTLTTE